MTIMTSNTIMQYKFHSPLHNVLNLINTTPLVNRLFKMMAGSLFAILLSSCANLNHSDPISSNGSNQNAISAKVMTDAESINSDSLQSFLEKVSKNHQIPLNDLKLAFEDTKAIPSIKKLVMPPPPGFQKNWNVYRSRFVEPRRLAAGQKFWVTHRSFIEKTEKETGVPAEIIVSIIGVETIYGRHMGGFSVRDTLSTLGFDYPNTPNKIARETLFKNQLEDLILLCWAENRQAKPFKTCLNQTGSYAGAIGLPQFMPGSIRSRMMMSGRSRRNRRSPVPPSAACSVRYPARPRWYARESAIAASSSTMSTVWVATPMTLSAGEGSPVRDGVRRVGPDLYGACVRTTGPR